MLRNLFTTLLFTVFTCFSFSQVIPYFNNIYNPENTYASGRGIIQQGNYYYGISGTENSSYYYRIGLFKMSISGELLLWKTIGENGSDDHEDTHHKDPRQQFHLVSGTGNSQHDE